MFDVADMKLYNSIWIRGYVSMYRQAPRLILIYKMQFIHIKMTDKDTQSNVYAELRDLLSKGESLETFLKAFKGNKHNLLLYIDMCVAGRDLEERTDFIKFIPTYCEWLTADVYDVIQVLTFLIEDYGSDDPIINEYLKPYANIGDDLFHKKIV